MIRYLLISKGTARVLDTCIAGSIEEAERIMNCYQEDEEVLTEQEYNYWFS